MTDDRLMPVEPPAEPPAPPSDPAPARARPWGLVAVLVALAAIALGVLYFTGAFGGGERRSAGTQPANGSAAAAAPAPEPEPENFLAETAVPAPTAPAAGGQVTAAWLAGGWGQACPGSGDPDVTFLPGGRFRLGSDPGRWTLSGNTITVTVDGRPQNSIMTWDVVNQNTARVTRVRTGDIYYVYRCPS